MNPRTSSPVSNLAPRLARSLVVLASASCAVESGPDQRAGGKDASTEEVVSSEAEVRASCTSPRKYFVTFRDASRRCLTVVGSRGRWLPEPLFSDAPADVQASTCAYRWAGESGAPVDRAPLLAAIGEGNGLAPACGASSEVSEGQVEAIPWVPDLLQAGSVGCDVCGLVRERKLWVILPPERAAKRQIEIALSNGEMRAFQIEPSGARALRITLPPPPNGTQYDQGSVQLR